MSRKKRKSRNNESNKNIRTEQEKKEYSYYVPGDKEDTP